MKPNSLHGAAADLESLILKQLLSASGAFKGGTSAGSNIRSEMFLETLADAVAQAGGIGLASQLEASMAPGQEGKAAPGPTPLYPHSHSHTHEAPSILDGAITSKFGQRKDPFTGESTFHKGMDVGAAEGTPISAAMGGVVKRAELHPGYGQMVEIEHEGGVSTLYAHASELKVKPGQRVEAGQEIALVGQTGRATGPHLHFEVRVNGHSVDPKNALKVYSKRAEESSAGLP
jgi:murein DD-endopeptidase MepM/ murein hydrolase activator NlpD